jgi:hypothetical protein
MKRKLSQKLQLTLSLLLLLTSCGVESILRQADQSYELGEYKGAKVKYTDAVTALDRLHNDSKPQKEKIKL